MMKNKICLNNKYKKALRSGFCISLILVMLMISGCSEKMVEYVTETAIEENENQDTGNTLNGQDGPVDVPSSVSYIIDGNGEHPSYKVEASVSAAGMENAGIYDAEFDVVDDAYLKALADVIFDDGEYYIMKPYHASTKEELIAEQERLQEIGESAAELVATADTEEKNDDNFDEENPGEEQYPAPVLSRLEALEQELNTGMDDNADMAKYYGEGYIMHKYDSRWLDDYSGNLLGFGMPDISERGMDSTTYMAGTLRGSIDGNVCELNAWTISCPAAAGSRGLEKSQSAYTAYRAVYNLTFLGNPVSVYQECALDDESEEQYGQNVCDIEEAEQQAGNMLSELGFSDYMKVDTHHLLTDSGTATALDGYCFSYVYAPDGIPLNYLNTQYADYKYGGIDEADSWVSVYVNSGSIAYVSVSCPITVTGEKETEKLKTFSEIDALAQLALTTDNQYGEPDMTCKVYAVKLVYGIVTEDEESHSLRPMWIYCAVDDSEINISHKCVVVAVDAVNGNIISCAGLMPQMTEYFQH